MNGLRIPEKTRIPRKSPPVRRSAVGHDVGRRSAKASRFGSPRAIKRRTPMMIAYCTMPRTTVLHR
jgi:hypothetical protein